MFNILRRKDFITERLLNFFAYEYKKATNLGKLGKFWFTYFHKRLFEISGKPVMSNCGTASEQCSVLLDYHLKKIMQKSWSYIKDSEYFI